MAKDPKTTITDDKKPEGLAAPEGADGAVEAKVEDQLEPDGQDAATELAAQLEQLRRSEEAAKERAARAEREREEAIRRAREREAEVIDFSKKTHKSELDAVSAGLAAASAASEAAQRDIEAAIANSDYAAQAKAFTRLARAQADIARLEDGKAALEARTKEVEERKPSEPAPTAPANDIEAILARTNLPPMAKDWLRVHQDYLTDPRKNAKLQALHYEVIDEGHKEFTPPYFESVERRLGMRNDDTQVRQNNGNSQGGSVVSAPVSRENPTGGGIRGRKPSEIRLTQEQKEYAKIAGISEVDYAKGLQRLAEEKANGNYGGRP